MFYLPIEFPIVLDGLRPDDPAFQAEIDARLLDILKWHDIDYRTIKGSVEERLEEIERELGHASLKG